MDKAQTGVKITGRSSNKLRYAYDTTLMAKITDELKSLMMNVKEERENLA